MTDFGVRREGGSLVNLTTTHSRAPINIVICADGTGNHDIKARGTNVFKLYEAVDIHGHENDASRVRQIAIYGSGVGTSSFLPKRAFDSVTGFGFSTNVRTLYRWLVEVYQPGDKLFLFGFSRGAYTVRALSGLLSCTELLDPHGLSPSQIDREIKTRWSTFERTLLSRGKTSNAAREQPTSPPQNRPPIAFLGVWDTVGALGLPFIDLTRPRHKYLRRIFFWVPWFGDNAPCEIVERACQALALDDERTTFRPELWKETAESPGRVKQVWFAGAHANVGGGYPRHGMSLEALDWMMHEAKAAGLRFVESDSISYREHRDVHDKLYDSRAGLGLYYRWQPRRVVALCREQDIVLPKVHGSVFERIVLGTDGYAPLNIPLPCDVTWTRTRNDHTGPASITLPNAESLDRQRKPELFSKNLFLWLVEYVGLQLCVGFFVAALLHGETGIGVIPWLNSKLPNEWFTSTVVMACVAAGFTLARFALSLADWSLQKVSTRYKNWRDWDSQLEENSPYRSLLDRCHAIVLTGKSSYWLFLVASLGGVVTIARFVQPNFAHYLVILLALTTLCLMAWYVGNAVDERLSELGTEFWRTRREALRTALSRASSLETAPLEPEGSTSASIPIPLHSGPMAHEPAQEVPTTTDGYGRG